MYKRKPDMTLELLLQELRADPESFLRHYWVKIYGNHDRSEEVNAWVSLLDKTSKGFTTGISGARGKTKDRPMIEFRLQPTKPDGVANLLGSVKVWNVAMKQLNEDVTATHLALPIPSDTDIMLTGQLSGCTFGVGMASNTSQIVSHIQPPNQRSGTQDYKVEQLDPTVKNGLTDGVRGLISRATNLDYDNEDAFGTVLGVLKKGSWRFYAQFRTLTGNWTDQEITSACRFA